MPNTIPNSSRFIQEDIMANGILVATVIQMLPVMPHLIAFTATLMRTEEVIILMLSVIVVIHEELQIKPD
jgi:hypothetical protein